MSVASAYPPNNNVFSNNFLTPTQSTISPKNSNLMMRPSNTTAVRPGFRGKCRYKSGRCPNERTLKFNGEVHTMCEEHRIRHNNNQRKSDMKRRVKKHPEPTKDYVFPKREVQKALPGLYSPTRNMLKYTSPITVKNEVRSATCPTMEPHNMIVKVDCTDAELEASRTKITEIVLSQEEVEILQAIFGIHDKSMML
ncbi:hypothetical protein THRCLA_06002 [Thraustotheca clavata]|uniref:Uncharacterized protein n=1 Tax=Thraustotheca clavata TaxID=74557 RepID=A0A1V9ZQN1_9STRA|nr:hypothetical protein THRCLA_06002 [Thraustotheca clavata]